MALFPLKSIHYMSKLFHEVFHGVKGMRIALREPAAKISRVPPLASHLKSHRPQAVVSLIFKSQTEILICYAARQVSMTAGALISGLQLGGIRCGRVHAPSRIFFTAM